MRILKSWCSVSPATNVWADSVVWCPRSLGREGTSDVPVLALMEQQLDAHPTPRRAGSGPLSQGRGTLAAGCTGGNCGWYRMSTTLPPGPDGVLPRVPGERALPEGSSSGSNLGDLGHAPLPSSAEEARHPEEWSHGRRGLGGHQRAAQCASTAGASGRGRFLKPGGAAGA